jgi:hypothetical protein
MQRFRQIEVNGRTDDKTYYRLEENVGQWTDRWVLICLCADEGQANLLVGLLKVQQNVLDAAGWKGRYKEKT